MIGTAPFFLTINASVSANTLKEFVDYARARPGQLNYGSAGNGTPPHVVMEMFKSVTGLHLVHIAYKSPPIIALTTSDLHAMFDLPASFAVHARAGKVRQLAVASGTRHVDYPDVPTMAEAGVPGFEASAWFGLMAPRGTPREIAGRLNAETNNALATKALRDTLTNLGFDPAGNTPE